MHTVLSIKQPHALLCLFGDKIYETRSWDSPYRGTLLIHASGSALTRDEWELMADWRDRGWVSDGIMNLLGHGKGAAYAKESIWYGAILGSVELTAIYNGVKLMPHLTEQERAFGWFDRADRRAWRFENPRLFQTGIVIGGQLKLWEYEGDLPDYITAEDIEERRQRMT